MELMRTNQDPPTRRLNEKDNFAVMMPTSEGAKIIETFPTRGDLRREYQHYLNFSKSKYYLKDLREVPFPAEFAEGINFDGPLGYLVLDLGRIQNAR